jgi:hypothetical protein
MTRPATRQTAIGVQVTTLEVVQPGGYAERQGDTARVAGRHHRYPAGSAGIVLRPQVEVASGATERGRGAQLGSPSVPDALGDLLLHH